MLSDEVVVFDNVSGKLYFVNYVDANIPNAYEDGISDTPSPIEVVAPAEPPPTVI